MGLGTKQSVWYEVWQYCVFYFLSGTCICILTVAIVAVRQWHWGQEKGDGVGGSARVWPALRHPNRVTWRCYKTKCRVEEDNNYFETKVTKNECQTISKKVTRIIFIYWSQISYISFHCDIIFALLKAESSILHGFFWWDAKIQKYLLENRP